MASVFLSYVREDAEKARSLAAILERAGHSVWWDRQIKGGAQYSAEIEAALDAAEKVVVLWSAKSVQSAWVRDEAAAGRDTGRLVPAALDDTRPPLGFRQFQTIDLSKWNGRGSAPGIKDLLVALDTPQPSEASLSSAPRVRSKSQIGRPVLLAGAAAVLAAAVATGIWFWSSERAGDQPRIAIAAADGSPLSRQSAHDLAVALPNLSGATAAAYELLDTTTNPSTRANVTLAVGATSAHGHERRDLVLRASDQTTLWTASIDDPADSSANLPQQLAVRAQRALSCTADALSYRRETIGQDMLKLYVSGCTSFDNAYNANADNSAQIKLFEQVLSKAPHFEPAWAKLFVAEIGGLDGADDRGSVKHDIATHIEKAQSLGLDLGELYAARAAALPAGDFVGRFHAYDEGIKRHPDNATLYRSRAQLLLYVGRMNDSVEDSAHAVQLDGLSPANQNSLVLSYAYAGNADAALAQLRKAEQLWPGSPAIVFARYGLELRYGDPKEALALLQEPFLQGPLQSEQAAFLRARIAPTTENIKRSIAEDEKLYHEYPDFTGQILQTLGQFGHKDEIFDILLGYHGGEQNGVPAEVIFRPAFHDIWRDPRSMAAAAHLGLLRYWRTSRNWPDFCNDPTLPYDCKKEASKYRV